MQMGQRIINEKEKYAKMLEQRELQSIGANYEDSNKNLNGQFKRGTLGKVVSQMEMNNAEARSQLKEMLEYQIKEKERLRQEEQQIQAMFQL